MRDSRVGGKMGEEYKLLASYTPRNRLGSVGSCRRSLEGPYKVFIEPLRRSLL